MIKVYLGASINNGNIITPFWTNTSSVTVSISFSGTTKITADFVLERKNSNGTYTVVKTFPTKTTNSASLRFSDTATITTGYTYRLSLSATVTRNGTNETVSGWVEKKA